MKMRKYNITGMSCAACSARVEKAVKALPDAGEVNVNLLTNSMSISGNVPDADVIKAVRDAGYGCSVKTDDYIADDTELPKLIARLIISVVISAALMYISMADTGLPGWLQPVLALAVMIINHKFFVNGFKGIIHRAPNMDTLVALGSLASFIYGYYDSAAMILALITVGKTLEAYSKGKTTNAIRSLMKLVPQVDIKPGDEFEVKPGENIPADAVVLEGISAVDESALTGESIPADKQAGDTVSAGTVNKSGYLKCRAERVGNDTALGRIIRMVSDASSTKAPIAKIADKVAGVFVPVVIGIAIVTFIIWMLTGAEVGFALSRAISVLVISCPCALGLATPVAIMVGSGKGAKNGILFKTAVSLEQTGKIRTAVLDKTGTVTSGEPAVTDIIDADGKRLSDSEAGQSQTVVYAYALESRSEHPLARAIVRYAEEHLPGSDSAFPDSKAVTDFKVLPGNGLSAFVDGKQAYAGNIKFISELTVIPEPVMSAAVKLSEEGKTPMAFILDGKLLGMIAVADSIKPDSAQAISQLKNMGIRVVMLTGDNERTAQAIGAQAGVDEVIAGVLPEGKAQAVAELQKQGAVMMVGDGINDAPALTVADVGVAIGAGTDVAIDAADAVLMKNSLLDVAAAVRLSRAVIRNIHQNLFWAFFYNSIGIPLAAGVFIPLTGWQLNPMFCAAAMSLSSFFVVMNALRLNLLDVYDTGKDRPISGSKPNDADIGSAIHTTAPVQTKPENEDNIFKEETKMFTTTIEVEGMMCPMCEKHTNEAIQKAFDVIDVKSDHNAAKTVIVSSAKLDETRLAEVIKEAGYKPGSVTVTE